MEVVVASSSIDGGIDYWDVHTGAEQLRYKTCVSPPHGLACVGQRFLASSQLRDPSANSGYILYWSWSKPQVEVKSFPSEPIQPIAATKARTSLVEVYLVIFTCGRLPLEDAVAKGDSSFVVKLQSTIKFNGGGHINHSIF